MIEDTNIKEAPGMELTAASAAFATALMPEQLPKEIATFVQIRINDLLAKVQADVQQTVASAMALPPTPVLPSNPGTPDMDAPQAAPEAALAAAGIRQPANGSQEVARAQVESQTQEPGFGKANASNQNRSMPYDHPKPQWDAQ